MVRSERAQETNEAYLAAIDLDTYLTEAGIYHEVRHEALIGSTSPATIVHQFFRQGHSIDVTAYGDPSPQILITQTGLDITIADMPDAREAKIFATFLLVGHLRSRIASLESQYEYLAKENFARAEKNSHYESDLLAVWDRLSKKRRAKLESEYPVTYARLAALVEERDRESYYDSLDNE